MKRNIVALLFALFTASVLSAQVCPTNGHACDPYIQVAGPAGSIQIDHVVPINVLIGNAGAPDDPFPGAVNIIRGSTLRVQLSVGCNATIVPAQTFANWTVLSTTATTIILTYNLDIAEFDFAAIDILVKGKSPTGGCSFNNPSNVTGNISYLGDNFDCSCSGPCPGIGPAFISQGDVGVGSNNNSQTSVTVNALTLPVGMSSFDGNPSNCNAQLRWKTSSEENVSKFEVEYSKDAVNFITIGTVAAKDISTGTTYGFVYGQENGFGYYRLKVIDKDGRYSYSPLATVKTKCNGKDAKVLPNPLTVNENLSVLLSGYKGDVKGELMSISGQLIRAYELKNGVNTLVVEKLTQGTYILRVTEVSSGDADSFRVIVIK